MIKTIINVIVLVCAIPIGYLISYLCNDELVIGRIWFKRIIVSCFVVGIIGAFTGYNYITLTCAFLGLISLISWIKSYDSKWTKRRAK